MLAESRLLDNLHEYAYSPTGEPAYPLRVHLQALFREDPTTPEMMAFNRSMRNVCVSVEWIFGDIVNYFKFMDFKKDLKIGLSQGGKMYIVSAMLRML